MTAVELSVNGQPVSAHVSDRLHLADFLRETQGLTGTHIGCEHGVCGACTIEIDGEIARSCITYAAAADGMSVCTIEAFDDDPLMARLRTAFTAEHALQCGYCTPGMLITARDLIRRRGRLSADEIRVEMSGNLCRCTGYVGIVRAISRVMDDPELETMRAALAGSHPRTWLGPAPGPMARETAKVAERVPTAPTPIVTTSTPVQSSRRRPVVKSGPVRVVNGLNHIEQSVVLDHPIEAVWALFSVIDKVIVCVPGATLAKVSDDGRAFEAGMAVALGPIRTTFSGSGTFDADASRRECLIEGRGADRSGPSRAHGALVCRLFEDGQSATRIETTIDYALTGPLAQVGRPSLVAAMVATLGADFAANVDARLSGQVTGSTPAPAARAIGGFGLLLRLVGDWLRRLTGGRS